MDDDSLVQQAREGDAEAFAKLVHRYRERVYQVIYRFTRNHGDTDDLAQETFLQAFRNLHRFRKESSFYTWLLRIAVNQSLNYLKKMKREKGKQSLTNRLEPADDLFFSSPESRSLSGELRERLEEAIDSLPLPYRTSFVMVVLEGLSHGEAARVIRCSEGTVSWRMHKARKILQAKLKPYLNEVRDELPKI